MLLAGTAEAADGISAPFVVVAGGTPLPPPTHTHDMGVGVDVGVGVGMGVGPLCCPLQTHTHDKQRTDKGGWGNGDEGSCQQLFAHKNQRPIRLHPR